MNKLKLSVIIPTYNRKGMLKGCLNSLFEQTYPKDRYEIIVVDDGSTDGTEDLVKNLQKSYSNLVYLKQQNQGPAAARNLGAQHAKADIFVFTDSDCVMPPDFLNNVVSCFKRNPGISACTGQEIPIFVNGPFKKLSEYFKSYYEKKRKKETIFDKLTPQAKLIGSRSAIKKGDFWHIGGGDAELKPPGEDVDLGSRFLKEGFKICITDNIFIYHIQRGKIFDLFRRYYNFGILDTAHYKRYFKNRFILSLSFNRLLSFSSFSFTFFLNINSLKVTIFILILMLFYPWIGLVLLFLYFLKGYIDVRKKIASFKIFFYTSYMYI